MFSRPDHDLRFTMSLRLTLCLLLAGMLGVQAQTWHVQTLFPESTIMHAVAMRTGSTGVAVGDSGIIRRAQNYTLDTELRRLLWSSYRLEGLPTLNDVALLAGAGYVVVGEGGSVLWSLRDDALPGMNPAVTSEDLYAVAVHQDVVIVGGANGTLMRSTDRARTFEMISVPTVDDVIDVCVDGEGIWTAITQSHILRSTTSGLTWSISEAGIGVVQRRISAAYRPQYEDLILYRLGDPWVYEVSTNGGVSWVSVFGPATTLRQQYPNAKALSMSVNSSGFQQSIMFVNDPQGARTPFHFVSFNATISWYDLCTLFFNEFVGTAQAMVNDTTLISTALGGPMLTFNKVGSSIQPRWTAPESVTIPFQTERSAAKGASALVADRHAVLKCTNNYDDIEYIFNDQFVDVRDVTYAGDFQVLLADTITYDGVSAPTQHWPRIYTRKPIETFWTLQYEHDDAVVSSQLSSYGNTILAIPAGRNLIWYELGTSSTRTTSYGDDNLYNTTCGVLQSDRDAWMQVIDITNQQTPLGRYTTNAGETWRATAPTPFYGIDAVSTDDGTLIVSGYERVSPLRQRAFVARSTDRGITWEQTLNAEVETTSFNYYPLDHRTGRTLLVAPSRAWISDTDGNTWVELQNIILAEDDHLASGHVSDDSTIVLYSNNGLVMITRLGGSPVSVQERTSLELSVRRIGEQLITSAPIVSAVASDLQGRIVALKGEADGTLKIDPLDRGIWFVRITTSTGGLHWSGVLP